MPQVFRRVSATEAERTTIAAVETTVWVELSRIGASVVVSIDTGFPPDLVSVEVAVEPIPEAWRSAEF